MFPKRPPRPFPSQVPTIPMDPDPYGLTTISGFYGPGAWSGWYLANLASSLRIYTKPYARIDPNTWLFLTGTNWAAIDINASYPNYSKHRDSETRAPVQRLATHGVGFVLPSLALNWVAWSVKSSAYGKDRKPWFLANVHVLTLPFLSFGNADVPGLRSAKAVIVNLAFHCILLMGICICVSLPVLVVRGYRSVYPGAEPWRLFVPIAGAVSVCWFITGGLFLVRMHNAFPALYLWPNILGLFVLLGPLAVLGPLLAFAVFVVALFSAIPVAKYREGQRMFIENMERRMENARLRGSRGNALPSLDVTRQAITKNGAIELDALDHDEESDGEPDDPLPAGGGRRMGYVSVAMSEAIPSGDETV
ncbi:hypothetical protein K491DRAFT_681618 [Lophiostoma macrostomum CBS 122681]|uniref:Uncharacterized protein n=1 Tax=Lophiostoma macrostomum CBS 122681 TaxID=1314788 RepID=A0A6A6SWY6_9PLEO|nr:hypothetical protein K491DRAFT_681618 [Lophiostoma macrostomum CBS 122681]